SLIVLCYLFFFFFQAEDGIRDRNVTGVQTCALLISTQLTGSNGEYFTYFERDIRTESTSILREYKPEGIKGFNAYLIINGITGKIGRASCRERWYSLVMTESD